MHSDELHGKFVSLSSISLYLSPNSFFLLSSIQRSLFTCLILSPSCRKKEIPFHHDFTVSGTCLPRAILHHDFSCPLYVFHLSLSGSLPLSSFLGQVILFHHKFSFSTDCLSHLSPFVFQLSSSVFALQDILFHHYFKQRPAGGVLNSCIERGLFQYQTGTLFAACLPLVCHLSSTRGLVSTLVT